MVVHGAGESGTSSIIRQEEDLTCGQSQGVIDRGPIDDLHPPSSISRVPSHPGITGTRTSTRTRGTIVETLISPLIISVGRQSVIVSSPEPTPCILICNMISSEHNNNAGCYLGIKYTYPEFTIFTSIGTYFKCHLQYTTICK